MMGLSIIHTFYVTFPIILTILKQVYKQLFKTVFISPIDNSCEYPLSDSFNG